MDKFEYLRWKNSLKLIGKICKTEEKKFIPSLSMLPPRFKNPSYSFLLFSTKVEIGDTEEEEKKAEEIYKYVNEKYPDVDITFTNEKKGKAIYGRGGYLLTLPEDKGILDEECVVKAIRQLEDIDGKKKLKFKYYYAYIYKIMQEGWVGSGWEKKSIVEFVDFLERKGVKGGKKTVLSDHCPYGEKKRPNDSKEEPQKWPHWNFSSNATEKALDNKKQIEQKQCAIEFAKSFIDTYWELKGWKKRK